MNTMFDLQQYALQELKDAYTEHEIKVLCSLAFCHLLHCTNIEIHLKKHEFLEKSFIDKFVQVVEELKTDKPIQYILGESEFAGIDFQLNSETLIPGPVTEELVMWIVESGVRPGARVLDIGTGSGCIIVSLGKLLKGGRFYGVDISTQEELISARLSVPELCRFVGADSLRFLTEQEMQEAYGGEDFCFACFDGRYVTRV